MPIVAGPMENEMGHVTHAGGNIYLTPQRPPAADTAGSAVVAVAHSHVATDRGWTPAYRGKRRRGLRNGPWLASPAPTQQRPASLDLGRLQALCIGRQCRPRPALREPNAATAHARAPSICAGRDGMRRHSIIDETTTDTHETYLFNTYGNQVIYLFIYLYLQTRTSTWPR